MQYVNMGHTGLKVSPLCVGCMSFGSKAWREWVIEEEEARPVIERALELGINFFDTADVYSRGVSEEIVGRALKDFARRDQVVIATKVYNVMGDGPNDRGLSRKHIMDAIDASLKRLQTDYVDLYQIHRWDRETPIEETMEALHDVVKAGKARYIGASSMYAWQFAQALYTADMRGLTRFVTMQNHYNLVYREEEREMNPLCLSEGIGLLPWSPLARGLLTGSRTREGEEKSLRARSDDFTRSLYVKDTLEADFEIVERVAETADKRGVSRAQVALAWVRQKPGVSSVIVGMNKTEYVDDIVASLDVTLSEEEMAYLEAPYVPHTIAGHS